MIYLQPPSQHLTHVRIVTPVITTKRLQLHNETN